MRYTMLLIPMLMAPSSLTSAVERNGGENAESVRLSDLPSKPQVRGVNRRDSTASPVFLQQDPSRARLYQVPSGKTHNRTGRRAGLTDRLRDIRRRTADEEISKPFVGQFDWMVENPMESLQRSATATIYPPVGNFSLQEFSTELLPTEEFLVDESLVELSPVDETLTGQSPGDESLTEQSPVDETLAGQSPGDESLTEQSPVDESLTGQSPADETHTGQSPVDETLVEQLPAEEPLTTEPFVEQLPSEPTLVSEASVVDGPIEGQPTAQAKLPVAAWQPTSGGKLKSVTRPQHSIETLPIVDLRSEPNLTQRKGFAEPTELQADSDVLVANCAPSLSFETSGPKTITIGKSAKYHVNMFNTGEVDARNLIVAVRLPLWAEVAGHSTSEGVLNLESDIDQNTVIRWNIRHLPAHSKEQLTLKIIPCDSRPFDMAVGWALAPGQSLAQILVQEPKLAMHISGPVQVQYGETDTFAITLSNPGNGIADNVVLNLLPADADQEPVGSRKIGSLAPGDRKTVELELTAHQAGQLEIRAMAKADGGLQTQSEHTIRVCRAVLDVRVTGQPHAYTGKDATYKLQVDNHGDAAATDTIVSATVPSGAKLVSCSDGGHFDPAEQQIYWKLGDLSPDITHECEFRCILTTAGNNRVEVSATAAADIEAIGHVVTEVEAVADLRLLVNDPQGPIGVGDDVCYEVKVINRGSEVARNVRLVGYFSNGIEPVSVTGWRGQIGTGQVHLENIGQLAAGQQISVSILARAHQPGNHVFRAELNCAMPETRLASEEWTNFYGQRQVAANPTDATSQEPLKQSSYPLRQGPMISVDALR